MKKNKIAYHFGFWFLYLLIFTIIRASYKENYHEAFIIEFIRFPMSLVVVYFNYLVLFPKLLKSGNYVQYIGYTLLLLLIASFVQRLISYEVLSTFMPTMRDLGRWRFYKFLKVAAFLAIPLITFIGISILWRYLDLQKQTQRLEKEKLQAELNYLKSQINPHFLFNTLNNIYSLSLENSKKTSQLILEFSEFLSFSLYESGKKTIPLKREIDLINNFVALEKSRFEDRVNVMSTIDKQGIDTYMIPPLILVPFVENAFKHSLKEETDMAEVRISLKVDTNFLVFNVRNSKPMHVQDTDTNHGVGLENIRKRLEILFGDEHRLIINSEPQEFSIILTINLVK